METFFPRLEMDAFLFSFFTFSFWSFSLLLFLLCLYLFIYFLLLEFWCLLFSSTFRTQEGKGEKKKSFFFLLSVGFYFFVISFCWVELKLRLHIYGVGLCSWWFWIGLDHRFTAKLQSTKPIILIFCWVYLFTYGIKPNHMKLELV